MSEIWNVRSLKEYLSALRQADKEALTIAMSAAQRAVDKAEEAQLRVNTTQNEFRGTLKDQNATMMPRKEVEQLIRSQQKEMDTIKRLLYIGLGIVLALQFVLQFAEGN